MVARQHGVVGSQLFRLLPTVQNWVFRNLGGQKLMKLSS
ncbi:hypothetical protein I5481_20950 [Citrobacter freundii]|nr:hypothetical protein [Citrobacter freundii]